MPAATFYYGWPPADGASNLASSKRLPGSNLPRAPSLPIIKRKGAAIPQRSAGLLLYKREAGVLKVLLAHPGGPFWARKDLGAWGIPKGLIEARETAREAAIREFTEETGFSIDGELLPLGEVIQRGGKHVEAWALEGDCDPIALKPFLFEMEWPPRSGRRTQFPEIDRVAWFTLAEARGRILAGQAAFLDRLEHALSGGNA